ncbi:MAG TPA: hypothetical protein VMW52_06980 [Phycisphaerae bacterium]|nr:hypothetical protein [Phycisphaerae bacterium]
MGDFDTTMVLAAEAAFAALGTESVVYTPAGGTARTIDAVIQRLGIEGHFDAPAARVKVRQDGTLGIDAAQIDTGGDTLAWPPKRGGAQRTSRITGIAAADAGFVTLEVL